MQVVGSVVRFQVAQNPPWPIKLLLMNIRASKRLAQPGKQYEGVRGGSIHWHLSSFIGCLKSDSRRTSLVIVHSVSPTRNLQLYQWRYLMDRMNDSSSSEPGLSQPSDSCWIHGQPIKFLSQGSYKRVLGDGYLV